MNGREKGWHERTNERTSTVSVLVISPMLDGSKKSVVGFFGVGVWSERLRKTCQCCGGLFEESVRMGRWGVNFKKDSGVLGGRLD